MSIETAKNELDNVSEFQKELHSLSKEDLSGLSNPVYSVNQSTVKKLFWSVRTDCKLIRTIETDNIVYEVTNNFHFLRDITLHQNLPLLKVKEEYADRVEICYPHNLAHAFIITGSMYIGETKVGYLDTICLDQNVQYNTDPGQTELVKINIGNIPLLEKWSSVLPKYTTISKQPFYFDDHIMYSVPLLYLNSNNKVTFKYRFRNRYQDLIKMRYRATKTDEWKEIPFNNIYLMDVQPDSVFSLPDIYGRYTTVTEEEVKMHKSRLPVTQYINCYHPIDSKRKYKFGETVEIDIKCAFPIHRFYPVAINDKAFKSHNYSNYSTNSSDVYCGYHPISHLTLSHRGREIYDNVPIEHFERREPLISKCSSPTDPGYAMCNLGHQQPPPFTNISLMFNDQAPAHLSLELHDTNPYLSSSSVNDSSEEFVVAIRLVTTRRLIFNVDGSVSINNS